MEKAYRVLSKAELCDMTSSNRTPMPSDDIYAHRCSLCRLMSHFYRHIYVNNNTCCARKDHFLWITRHIDTSSRFENREKELHDLNYENQCYLSITRDRFSLQNIQNDQLAGNFSSFCWLPSPRSKSWCTILMCGTLWLKFYKCDHQCDWTSKSPYHGLIKNCIRKLTMCVLFDGSSAIICSCKMQETKSDLIVNKLLKKIMKRILHWL